MEGQTENSKQCSLNSHLLPNIICSPVCKVFFKQLGHCIHRTRQSLPSGLQAQYMCPLCELFPVLWWLLHCWECKFGSVCTVFCVLH